MSLKRFFTTQFWASLSWVREIRLFLKQTSLPGFFGVSIYDVISLIIRELKQENIVTRANGMAFNFFISIFPILLILISLLPLIPIEGFERTFYSSFMNSLPLETKQFLERTIEELGQVRRGNLISTSILIALFFASNGILSMVRGFEKSYEFSFSDRNFIKKRLISLWLLFLLGALVFGGCLLILIGQSLQHYLTTYSSWVSVNNWLVSIVRWIFIFSIIYTMISSIYRFAPAFRKKTNFFSPGAMLTTILIIATTLAFGSYVNRFDTYNRIYGSIGTIIATMVWIQLNCFVLLVGFELNASIVLNRDMQSMGINTIEQ